MGKDFLKVAAFAAAMLSTNIALANIETDCQNSQSPELRVKACTKLLKSENLDPSEQARIYKYRAAAHAELRQEQKAIDDYTQAIRLKSNFASAYTERGHVKLALSNFEGAVADFSEAIRINPKSSSVFVARGYAYLVEGKLERAIIDFTKAIETNSKNAVAFNNRGIAYRKQNRIESAIKDYTKAIQINPIYALAYSNRGNAYELEGDKNKAIADFKSAIFLDPSLSGARNGLKRLGVTNTLTSDTDELVRNGQLLAQKNCAWCHAIGREKNSPNKLAPPFRNIYSRHPILDLREPLTRSITYPHDAMPKLRLSDWEIDTIIAYINSLSLPK